MRMICPLSKSGSPAAPGSATNPTGRTTGEAGALRARAARGRPAATGVATCPSAVGATTGAGAGLSVGASARTAVGTGRALRRWPTARAHPPRHRSHHHQTAAAAPSHLLQPLWFRTGATSASRVDCRLANASSSRGPSASESVRTTLPPPAPEAPGSTARSRPGGRRRIGSARRDSRPRHACLGRRCPLEPARRSRPAASGTSCEVPHAPERPADVRDGA